MNVGQFGGDHTDHVELVIDTIDFTFLLIKWNFPVDRRERAKLTLLYSYLTGSARAWWAKLEEVKRDT